LHKSQILKTTISGLTSLTDLLDAENAFTGLITITVYRL
jgi:hypothetical protein